MQIVSLWEYLHEMPKAYYLGKMFQNVYTEIFTQHAKP